MLLRVVVDPPQDFERWLDNEKRPGIADLSANAGRSAFLAQSCINCHAVNGTAARGRYAPDLTHLMARQTLAAGIVANTPENLRNWIENPQRTKPGCLMPGFGLSDRERNDIVAYLLTLR
jgi:cytochrome c oxidase subunit 2